MLLKRNRVAGARELLRAYLEVDPSGAGAERAEQLLERPYCATQTCAPDFEVITTTGTTIDSRELLDRVVLLDCWATGCQPCIAASAVASSFL